LSPPPEGATKTFCWNAQLASLEGKNPKEKVFRQDVLHQSDAFRTGRSLLVLDSLAEPEEAQ